MRRHPHFRHRPGILLLVLNAAMASVLQAGATDPADYPIRKFLAQDDTQRAYRATRRIEAESGNRAAWLEAVTEYSPESGFRYRVTGEGGSDSIRSKVLKAVLKGEQEVIARGEAGRSSLARANYSFQPAGIDAAGLANVIVSPRRNEKTLVIGKMFLRPEDGLLVRLQGRLAKSPSFWIKNVEIVRSYDRIAGAVVPVAMESKAQVRFLGLATLRMTYRYFEIDGRPVRSAPSR